ncbi:uncharacterized protein LOC126748093 [Anthonomus grandis grandis]|uniref:uncharacterized protein LOC126748093 n=1 Tax=Anthonomus grandis grandis TaxID=2921223 RepID=UPI00216639CB|nr:uncharacterized protein LOC126748093 [Anthonomus grandis grandis]
MDTKNLRAASQKAHNSGRILLDPPEQLQRKDVGFQTSAVVQQKKPVHEQEGRGEGSTTPILDITGETAPPMEEAFPGGSHIIECAFRRRGLTKETIQIMMSSISRATMAQYSSSLKLWWKFCFTNNTNVYSNCTKLILRFLSEMFQEGAAHGSLNCARSALSLIISSEIGSDPEIKRFFKGVQNLRPGKPRYNWTWNPSVVLTYLRSLYPNKSLTLQNLTFKLSTLLALITAHRVQFSLIELENIHKNQSGFQILIKDRIKTSGRNKLQPVLRIPYYLKDLTICAATTLDDYLEKTSVGQ